MNSKSDRTGNSEYQELSDKLIALEKRVALLESVRKSPPIPSVDDEDEEISFKFRKSDDTQYESNIGEYGLAWLGNVVLFFGITFLVEYLRISGYNAISSVFGFTSVAGIFGLAFYFRESNPYMARIFNLNGYLLSFYVTLKLHFLTADPIIASKALGLILLLAVTGFLLFLSIRKNFTILTGLSIILFAVTAVVSDSTHLMLPMATLISIIGTALLFRDGSIRFVFLSIFLVYLINLLWLLNNPLMGHQLQVITNPQSGYIYLFIVSANYSLIALMPSKEPEYSSTGIIGAIVFNGIGFALLMGLYILSFFPNNYVYPTGFIAGYCMTYSIILKVRSVWKISAALYALFGFVALTGCIYGIYHFPQAYFLLAFQSLLVVSMAIWFQSKFIVIMNSLMYITLLLVYLTTSPAGDAMNISFSFVALATARILNWKKERLTIKTDLLRNFYLITAFPMVLFTLHHLVPEQFVSLSWALAAVVYLLLSFVLKIVKYRYMALGTMIAASFYLFLVDLSRIELVYRVIALLSLAFISIGISFYYNKRLKKKIE
jgi:hypothetical protein